MKLMERIRRAPRGSALVTVIIFTSLMAVATVALIQFGVERRRESARMILRNAELTAAESVMERFVAQLTFVGRNRPPQVIFADTDGMAGFINNVVAADPSLEGYQIEAVIQNRTVPGEPDTVEDTQVITQDLIDELDAPELAEWMGYSVTYSVLRVMVGAKVADDNDDFALTSLQRPGVYLSRQVTVFQVPLLNYAIFYENTLELDAGAEINVYGRVHTNEDYYLTTSSTAKYHDAITVAGNFYGGIYNPGDAGRRTWSGSNNVYVAKNKPPNPGYAWSTDKMQLLKDSNYVSINNNWLSSVNYNSKPGDPTKWTDNGNWRADAQRMYNGMLKDREMGVQKVKLPINEAESPYLIIESPNPATDAVDKVNVNLGYQAAVVFQLNGGTVTAYNYVPDETSPSGFVKGSTNFATEYWPKGADTSKPAQRKSIISTVSIYNGREQKYVTMTDLNVGNLAEYMDPGATIYNPAGTLQKIDLSNPTNPSAEDGIIYFDPVQPAGGQAGARISNAKDMTALLANSGIAATNGLTFASSAPMYTKGDVNNPASGNHIPLLIAGDSMNILSNAFNDADYSASGLSGNGPKKGASTTTTNCVFIAGNVPTKTNQYGGGAENYFRYLEGWGTHNFKGSILNLFPSRIATVSWDKNTGTGASSGYYGAPKRNWSWDASFANGLTPPGMPRSWQATLGRWRLINANEFEDAGGTPLA